MEWSMTPALNPVGVSYLVSPVSRTIAPDLCIISQSMAGRTTNVMCAIRMINHETDV